MGHQAVNDDQQAPPPRSPCWQRLGQQVLATWFGKVLVLLATIGSVFMLVDFFNRVVGDVLQATVVAVITIIASSGIFSSVERSHLDSLWAWSSRYRTWVLGLFGVLLLFEWLALSSLAPVLHQLAMRDLANGQRQAAQAQFERALRFDPDFVPSLYQLGSIAEDLGNIDAASQFYRRAIQTDAAITSPAQDDQPCTDDLAAPQDASGVDLAYNNYGRLLLLQKHYDEAVRVLRLGLANLPPGDADACYKLHTKLAQARLGQGMQYANPAYYQEAERQLAIALRAPATSDRYAAAYCILALVGEHQGKGVANEWKACKTWANPANPDHDTWIFRARQVVGE